MKLYQLFAYDHGGALIDAPEFLIDGRERALAEAKDHAKKTGLRVRGFHLESEDTARDRSFEVLPDGTVQDVKP